MKWTGRKRNHKTNYLLFSLFIGQEKMWRCQPRSNFKVKRYQRLTLSLFSTWITLVFSPLLSQEQKNLLVNPSFEQGFAGWNCWSNQPEHNQHGFLVTEEGAAEGRQAVAIKGFSRAATIFALVEPVVPGGIYEFTFRYKSSMTSGKASAEIAFQTTKEVTPALWYRHQDWTKSGPLLQKTDAWVLCQLKTTVPLDKAIVKIVPKVNVIGQSLEDVFLIDDAVFRLVSSPESTSSQISSGTNLGKPASGDNTELLWGKAPNVIRNPGFELSTADHQPLYWRRKFSPEEITSLVQKVSPIDELPVANGDFEKVDGASGFFPSARIQKLGRVKFHKDIWKKGIDLKSFREKGYFSSQDVFPAVEETVTHSGARAFSFQVEKTLGYSWSEVVFDNMFEVQANQDYLLNFWYFHQGSQHFSGALWIKAGSMYEKLPDFSNEKEGHWQQHWFYFRSEGWSGKAAIQLWGICTEKGASGKLVFDDIRVYKLERWWEKEVSKVVQAGRRGDKALMVKGQAVAFLLASSRIGIDWHKVYRLSAWVKAENVREGNWIQVRWENYATKFDLKTLAVSPVFNIAGSFDWKLVSGKLIPPPGAQFLTVELNVSGGQGFWLVDDFFLDGFGDLEIEFLFPQAGYDSKGYKDIVIRTKKKAEVPLVLEIRGADSRKTIASRKMLYLGMDLWNCHYYGVDFSDLTTPGTYLASLHWENHQWVSPSWTINPGFYRTLARDGVKYFFYQRSGYEVPGWHKACHLDDAWVTSFNTVERYEHRNLTGGWFDAADLNKWLDPAGWYLRAICKTYDGLKDNTTSFLRGKFPDMVEEATWGANYLKRSYRGNGEFYYCVKIHDMLAPPDEDTDNIPGNFDDRCANVVLPETCATMGLAAFGLTLKKLKAPETEEYLKTAQDAFSWQTKTPAIVKKLKLTPLDKDTINLSLAALDLYLATSQKQYLDYCQEKVTEIAEACLAGQYVQPAVTPKGFTEEAKLLHFLVPLEEFALVFPEDKVAEKCRAALRLVTDHLARASRLSPLGHTHPLTEPLSPTRMFLSPSRSNTYILACAWHLAAGFRIFKNPELLIAAERNLQYILGRNYHGASCMAQVGWKWGAHFTFLSNCRGKEEGIIPFAVNKGHPLGELFFRKDMPYVVMPGSVSPLLMQEWNLEVYGVTQSLLLNALTNIAIGLH
ncbi:MAG: glycoside hydrolase family 9 protein [Candidatus Omnitrophica bacterium]|nr:glycoside hydrolase family 9 protein [Candidatus Omnitrophota bacterium]